EWRRTADASFRRDARSDERGEWRLAPGMPDRWAVEYAYKRMRLRMRLGLTSFKHVGIFPEQAANWNFIYDSCRALAGGEPSGGERVAEFGSSVAGGGAPKVLNLFAYTGGATLAARAAGAEVTHVDSVRQVVTWSRENMELSGLEGVRWIVEDALKFVRREVRRGSRYRGIILDPPAYGRGADGERWILEDNIGEMLECCAQLLEPRGAFLVLNLYSMGLSSTLARTAVRQAFGAPREEQWGELCFTDRAGKQLPLGTYYRFTR
ncbi:MAG: oxidoreductase, partial [Alistipes shahii]|nr:oxidoreductase [Alistipes shahii]